MKTLVILLSLTFVLSISGCGDVGGGSNFSSMPGKSVTLKWDVPTTNANGSELNDLGGYKIYYGTTPGNYTSSVDAGNVTTYQINNLTEGLTYYFAVTAYDTSGNESDFSNEVSKTIE